MKPVKSIKSPTSPANASPTADPGPPTPTDPVLALVERIKAASPAELPSLEETFKRDFPSFWEIAAQPLRALELLWVEHLAADDSGTLRPLCDQLDAWRTELCGPKPSSLEMLLVDRILLCYLRLTHEEAQQHRDAKRLPAPELMRSRQKQLKLANDLFHKAIRELAIYRKLVAAAPAAPEAPGLPQPPAEGDTDHQHCRDAPSQPAPSTPCRPCRITAGGMRARRRSQPRQTG